MHPVLQKSMMVRLVLTPLLWFTRTSIPLTIVCLTLLDMVDCNPYVLSFMKGTKTYCSLDKSYELYDKVVDLFHNIVAVYLLSTTTSIPVIPAMFLIAYRAFGIIAYLWTGNDKVYILFPEFIKEYLLLFWYFNGRVPVMVEGSGIVLKLVYEYLMHSEHVMLDAYKRLFE